MRQKSFKANNNPNSRPVFKSRKEWEEYRMSFLRRRSELTPVSFSDLSYEEKLERCGQQDKEHKRLEEIYPDLFESK